MLARLKSLPVVIFVFAQHAFLVMRSEAKVPALAVAAHQHPG
jgi:hypothetical protein